MDEVKIKERIKELAEDKKKKSWPRLTLFFL
jgi:hypothetical protein